MFELIFFPFLHNTCLDGERKVKRYQLLFWHMDGKGANLSREDSCGGVPGNRQWQKIQKERSLKTNHNDL